MKRVYIAGAYSAGNVIGVLNNMRKGIRASTKMFLAGYAPFCPWLDHHYHLMLRPGETLQVKDYYAYSMAWLEVSDLVYVLCGFEHSKGTLAEIKRAKELGIEIQYQKRTDDEEWPFMNEEPT